MKKEKKIKAWAIIEKNKTICVNGLGGKYHIYWTKFSADTQCKHFSKHKVVPCEILIKH